MDPELKRFRKRTESGSPGEIHAQIHCISKPRYQLSLVLSACTHVGSAHAQNDPPQLLPPPVTFTAAQDHQNMMDQLGIKALAARTSGNEKAPNHANYDEAVANPYPNIPDPLVLNNGQKVTTAKEWWDVRRPEIVTCFRGECLRPSTQNVPEGTLDRHDRRSRDDRLHAGDREGSDRRGGQLGVSGHQRQDPYDSGDPGERQRGRCRC